MPEVMSLDRTTGIHAAIAMIIRVSVRDRTPSGTSLSPPTEKSDCFRLSMRCRL